ncbi:MAG: hypothetical protein NTX50_05310 [Candidatus Sumerlaeota bacterium]|nr:hypothetical protein [Candidatus Sumerlaeota bacterium]
MFFLEPILKAWRMNRVSSCLRVALAPALAALAVSCSELGNYNDQMAGVRGAFAAGQNQTARSLMLERMEGGGKGEGRLNPWLELGIIDHTAGAYEQSSKDLQTAGRIVREFENRAVISARDAAGEAATMVINERAQPYQGEAFEKTLIHTFDAVNYMMRNDWEGAAVEARRGYQRQEEIAKRCQSELEEARKQAQSPNPQATYDQAQVMKNYESQFANLRPVASRVANAYQNAFTNYISGVIFNAHGDYNDAYIELKRADQWRPGAPCLGPLLIETAMKGGFPEDVKKWEAKYRLNSKQVMDWAGRNPCEVIVIFENGWAPVKEQIKIPIPTPHAIGTLALPRYELQGGFAQTLRVSAGGQQGATDLMGDIEGQAARCLLDRMPYYVIKGALRVAARLVAENIAAEQRRRDARKRGQNDDLAQALMFAGFTALNIIVEQADLRAWTLLPKNLQVARLRLPEGAATFALSPEGGQAYGQHNVTMNLRRNRPNVILVRSTGGAVIVHTNDK